MLILFPRQRHGFTILLLFIAETLVVLLCVLCLLVFLFCYLDLHTKIAVNRLFVINKFVQFDVWPSNVNLPVLYFLATTIGVKN